MGTVVSDAPSSSIRKSSISRKIGGRNIISISIKKSSSSKNRIYWASPKYWPYLAAALNNAREPDSSKEYDPSFVDLMTETFPRHTVHNALKRLGNNPITLENVFPVLKRSLLPQCMVLFLQDTVRKRDEGDNGVLKKETIKLIVDLGGTCSDKQAENHIDYLIRMGRLDKPKRNGRVMAAQGTTTERLQRSVTQQYHWHCLIKSEWK